MQKAGLEGEVARLQRQRDAHFDDQLNVRRQIQNAVHDQHAAERRIAGIRQDIERRTSTRGDAFALNWEGRLVSERRTAGALILSKLRLAERAGKKGESATRLDRRLRAALRRRPRATSVRSRQA